MESDAQSAAEITLRGWRSLVIGFLLLGIGCALLLVPIPDTVTHGELHATLGLGETLNEDGFMIGTRTFLEPTRNTFGDVMAQCDSEFLAHFPHSGNQFTQPVLAVQLAPVAPMACFVPGTFTDIPLDRDARWTTQMRFRFDGQTTGNPPLYAMTIAIASTAPTWLHPLLAAIAVAMTTISGALLGNGFAEVKEGRRRRRPTNA